MTRDTDPREFDIDVWLEFDHDFEDEEPIGWEDEFDLEFKQNGQWEAMQAYWD